MALVYVILFGFLYIYIYSLDVFEIPETLTNIVSSTSMWNPGYMYSYFMYNAFLINFQA